MKLLTKTRENRWTTIRGILDEYFKGMTDNWWTATRHDLMNYEEFKQLFKAKYWSESTQNIVRDNLCNGNYDPARGTPTAYFLGKVCLGRNLEPKIPEECLVSKLAYHFEEGIIRARLCGQIKTIQGMATLLESYENENYYHNIRQRRFEPTQGRSNNYKQENMNRERKPHVNYVRSN